MFLWAWTSWMIFKGLLCTMYLIDSLTLPVLCHQSTESIIVVFSDELRRQEETLVHSSGNFSNQSMHVLYKKMKFSYDVFSIMCLGFFTQKLTGIFGCTFIALFCSDWFHHNCFSNKHSLCLFSVSGPKVFTNHLIISEEVLIL